MRFGLPIVACDCPAQENIIKKFECGLIFQANDAQDLANKIFHLYTNDDFRVESGKKGADAVDKCLN